MDETKSPETKVVSPADGPTLEHGHLQELEVDVARVLEDDGIEDLESDTSPSRRKYIY